jgi:hypothetical protein
MRTEPIAIDFPALPNNRPDYLDRPYLANCFPLHILSAIIGGRGSGKTTFAIRLLKAYDKAKSFDRIIIFSPTALKDPKVSNFIHSKTRAKITHYPSFKPGDLRTEMDQMEKDVKAWRTWKEHLAVWQKFVRLRYDVDKMEVDELALLDECGFERPAPPNDNELFPSHAIVFDDLVGCRVFSATMGGLANNLLISHRHYSCSVFVLSQTFTSFIPKQIRTNNIGLWVLFGTKCAKAMKDIADDVAAKVAPATFIRAWQLATAKPHTPLVCNYDAHDLDSMFRAGLDQRIVGLSENDQVKEGDPGLPERGPEDGAESLDPARVPKHA